MPLLFYQFVRLFVYSQLRIVIPVRLFQDHSASLLRHVTVEQEAVDRVIREGVKVSEQEHGLCACRAGQLRDSAESKECLCGGRRTRVSLY